MGSDRSRTGTTAAGSDHVRADDGVAGLADVRTPLRSATGPATSTTELADDRYHFLDEAEPEFMWHPEGGRGRKVAAARTVELQATSQRRNSGRARTLTLLGVAAVLVAAIAGTALYLKDRGASRPAARPQQPAPATSPAPAPAPVAAQPVAPVPAQGQESPPADAPATHPAPNGDSSPTSAPILEKPITPPPPGGEDGPPAPEPSSR